MSTIYKRQNPLKQPIIKAMKGNCVEIRTVSGAVWGIILEWGQGTEAPELVLTPFGIFRYGYNNMYYPA